MTCFYVGACIILEICTQRYPQLTSAINMCIHEYASLHYEFIRVCEMLAVDIFYHYFWLTFILNISLVNMVYLESVDCVLYILLKSMPKTWKVLSQYNTWSETAKSWSCSMCECVRKLWCGEKKGSPKWKRTKGRKHFTDSSTFMRNYCMPET